MGGVLHILELVIELKEAQDCAELFCAAHNVRPLGLYCAEKVPWLQHKLSLHIARENFVVSFHWVLFIGPPLWPCLYLKQQKEVLIRTVDCL